jgi:hypothetical protein
MSVICVPLSEKQLISDRLHIALKAQNTHRYDSEIKSIINTPHSNKRKPKSKIYIK